MSEDEESDDMGSTKPINKKASSVKKRKRNNTKQEEEEEEEDIVVPINNEQQQIEKKKMKKEKKPKQKATPKKKAPLDLDRQCGVLIAPSNNPCTRSLTCKIHAMGAKRAVEGRSHPFNELLAAYQKKGIGRPQVPSSTSSTNPTATSTLNEKDNKSTLSALNRDEGEEDIDSDEETESVRIAIEQNKPVPLGSKKVCYVRRKRKYYKLRDILLEAITPKISATTATGTSTELSL